mgnify:CR=1 FL=1
MLPFPFTCATHPDSYFSKEKTVKKKVKGAVVRPSGRTISPGGWTERSGGHYAFVREG